MFTRREVALSAAAAGLFAPTVLRAQTPVSAQQRLWLEGRYLPYYLELQTKTAAGDNMAKSMLSQYAAFLGDETTALGIDERPRDPAAGLPDLTGAQAQDAMTAILERAADARVVILNEAHNVSGHRAFAAQVMRALRPVGFNVFAAETFTPPQQSPAPDIAAYRRGTPFYASYGYYTFDPVYAETVREAARLGYRFAAYEQAWDQNGPDDAPALEQIARREQAQADNLKQRVLDADPAARVFVFCGYSHAMEKPGRGGTWFAARLKAATGIDPLTIEQSGNWPATRPENDAAHVSAVLDRFAPTAPVAVSKDGRSFGSTSYGGQMDLSVFHPRRPAASGRPGWLAADVERRAVVVDVPTFEGAALLQALWAAEGTAGIPADQLLLTPGQSRATLFLHPGSYFLRLETTAGIQPAHGEITVPA
jgi:hypothetical protein